MASSHDLLSEIRRELDARLLELRPLLAEYERLLIAADALDSGEEPPPVRRRRAVEPTSPRRRRATSRPAARPGNGAAKRAQRGAAATAIVAALEHGSHTVSELAIVTAMRGAIIRSNLSRLQQAGAVTRTKRAGDGKAAYALTVAPV